MQKQQTNTDLLTDVPLSLGSGHAIPLTVNCPTCGKFTNNQRGHCGGGGILYCSHNCLTQANDLS